MTWDQQPGADDGREPGIIDERSSCIFDAGHGGSGGGGDGDGFDDDDAALYARYSGRILRFFRNKIPSDSVVDANDLLTEVFLRFLKKRKSGPVLDKRGLPFDDPWRLLIGIAKNVLLEHIRRVTKMSNIDDIARTPVSEMGSGISTQVSMAEKRALVHEGLRQLPFYQHLVLDLCVYDHMSYREVADLLDIPFGSVATLRHQAGINLAKWMERQRSGAPAGSDDDLERERTLQAAYPWYEPSTGAIDHHKLVACVMRTRESSRGELPAWFVKLEIPQRLPNASPEELWNLVLGVWEAWIEAGRPQ